MLTCRAGRTINVINRPWGGRLKEEADENNQQLRNAEIQKGDVVSL
jgi:hypothetical protein